MSYELEFDDIDYDRGYGTENGTLVVEVSPILTDERFSGHNGAGNVQLFGNKEQLTDLDIEGGTMFLIDQDGGECGQIELEKEEVLSLISKDKVLEELQKRYYNQG